MNPRRAVPEANPLNSHGAARKLLIFGYPWVAFLVGFLAYCVASGQSVYEDVFVTLLLGAAITCVRTLRRL